MRVQEHQASLFGYLSRLGLPESTVDDVAQEAFLRAWRYRDRFDESRSQWNTWLFRIARNLAFTSMRRDHSGAVSTDPSVLEEIASHSNDPSSSAALVQKRQKLRRAIRLLSDNERDALALAYVQGIPSIDAAKILGCEPNAFRTRVSRARARLTTLLESTP